MHLTGLASLSLYFAGARHVPRLLRLLPFFEQCDRNTREWAGFCWRGSQDLFVIFIKFDLKMAKRKPCWRIIFFLVLNWTFVATLVASSMAVFSAAKLIFAFHLSRLPDVCKLKAKIYCTSLIWAKVIYILWNLLCEWPGVGRWRYPGLPGGDRDFLVVGLLIISIVTSSLSFGFLKGSPRDQLRSMFGIWSLHSI